MSNETDAVTMSDVVANGTRRRGRKPSQGAENGPRVLFFLGDGQPDVEPFVLKEKLSSEGEAMVESLKRGEPYYRVEVWQSRANIKNEVVAIEKEPVKAQISDHRADEFRKTNR